MDNILIDTDVILDFFFDRKPFAEEASLILSLCEAKEITGYVTPVIVSNIYYLLRREATHKKVIEKLILLLSFMEILILDKKIILHALHSDFRDFEDALQNFSAEKFKKIQVIVTRNPKDYKNSALVVATPDSYLKMRSYGL